MSEEKKINNTSENAIKLTQDKIVQDKNIDTQSTSKAQEQRVLLDHSTTTIQVLIDRAKQKK
jgi:hypothetical protein